MKNISVLFFAPHRWILPLLACAMLSASCNDGGGDKQSKDIGNNNPNVILAMGDSITNGRCVSAGAPYPARLAALTGKTVINSGICGEMAPEGASRVAANLKKHKPGTLLLLYGANDIIRNKGEDSALKGLRGMIHAAKANKTRVYIATLLPMYDDRAVFDGAAKALNNRIFELAKEENVGVVNLAKEFGSRRELIQKDGLHPSDMGTQIIAAAFADRF